MTRERIVWSYDAGFSPHKVTVYEELARGGTLYLRWRVGGNWKRRSLGRGLRDARGRIDRSARQWATEQAEAQCRHLKAGFSAEEQAAEARVTIREGLVLVTDPKRGKYPAPSGNRREVISALQAAARLWGGDRSWNSITKADLRELWRRRIHDLRAKGLTGHRGAEVTIARVLTVAAWLRDETKIAADACVLSRNWKRDLLGDWKALSGANRDPVPSQPRYTTAEAHLLLGPRAWDEDPRLGFLLALGAELRIGQVVRCRRSDLTIGNDDTGHAIRVGVLQVPSSGRKRGARVRLTAGQIRSVDRALVGYLLYLEAARIKGTLPDYPLFPSGQMRGGRTGHPVADVERHGSAAPVGRRTVGAWFQSLSTACGISVTRGRGLYALRRWAVDEYKRRKGSREGLMAAGGWTDTQMPDRIYADQEATYAEEEAMVIRASARGEPDGPSTGSAE